MEKMPAGFGIRVFANFFDFLMLTLPFTLIYFWLTGDHSYEWTMGWTWNILYTIYLTLVPLVWGGYIIGKRIFKIKVKRIDDEKLTIKNMILREVVGKFLVVYLTLGISNLISIFMIIFREDKRAIHDLIAGTYVSK